MMSDNSENDELARTCEMRWIWRRNISMRLARRIGN